MTERHHRPEPISDLEQEGIPEMEGSFPGEAATGTTWDGVVAPGDEPKGVEEFGITAAEERLDEPLSVRLDREIPDEEVEGESPSGDEITGYGRLVDPFGASVDDEGDLVGGMADYDPAGYSAEESAVHVVGEDEAGGITLDDSPDYVGDELPGGGAGQSPPRSAP